jgi:hypothetical protein
MLARRNAWAAGHQRRGLHYREKDMKPVALLLGGSLVVVALLAAPLAMLGCEHRTVVVRERPVVVEDRGPVIIREEPPQFREERMPPRPGRDHVWVSGYYEHRGDHYVWIPGRWEDPPRGHHEWVPAHYDRVRDGWRYVPGYWR